VVFAREVGPGEKEVLGIEKGVVEDCRGRGGLEVLAVREELRVLGRVVVGIDLIRETGEGEVGVLGRGPSGTQRLQGGAIGGARAVGLKGVDAGEKLVTLALSGAEVAGACRHLQ